MKINIKLIVFLLFCSFSLSSCGALVGGIVGGIVGGVAPGVAANMAEKKDKKKSKKSERAVTPSLPQLTEEQQRRYDYYFLEAARLKAKQEYNAAFNLLQHCLELNPNASSALYEMAQYYMFLKQKT